MSENLCLQRLHKKNFVVTKYESIIIQKKLET